MASCSLQICTSSARQNVKSTKTNAIDIEEIKQGRYIILSLGRRTKENNVLHAAYPSEKDPDLNWDNGSSSFWDK